MLATILRLTLLMGLGAGLSFAANCGGGTPCACGDTVTINYTLSANLSCPGLTLTQSALTVNNNSITIDGGGFSIIGPNTGPASPYTSDTGAPRRLNNCVSLNGASDTLQNIHLSGCQTAVVVNGTDTLTNITVDDAGYYGVNTGGGVVTMTGSTIKSVFGYAVRLTASGNTITGNTFSGNRTDYDVNFGATIQLVGSLSSNNISNNTFTNNAGVTFSVASGSATLSNTYSGNTITGQKISLFGVGGSGSVGAFPTTGFDTTNTVEGGPVYLVFSASGTTYDGGSLGDLGFFACTSCTNITVSNLAVKDRIYLTGTTGTINNVTISNTAFSPNNTGSIMVTGSSTVTVTGCTLSNIPGVGISANGGTTVSGNTFNRVWVPVYTVGGSSGNTITANTINQALQRSILDSGTSTVINNNTIKYPVDFSNEMATWTDGTRTASVAGTINFTFSLASGNGTTACPTCNYTVTTSPAENVSSSLASSTVTGSFVPSKAGTYSLIITVADSNGNTLKRSFIYLVGSTTPITQRYYMRASGRSGNVLNGSGFDAGKLSLTAPGADEIAAYCSGWTQFSPEDLPNYPYATLTSMSASSYNYSLYVGNGTTDPTFGLVHFTTYGNIEDVYYASLAVPGKYAYGAGSGSLSSFSWAMDSPNTWRRLAAQLFSTSTGHPIMETLSATPSYVDLVYNYASPAVKSISNPDVSLLSATGGGSPSLVFDAVISGTQSVVLTGLTSTAPYAVSVDGGTARVILTDSTGSLSLTTSSLSVGQHTVSVAPRTNVMILIGE
jgi:hypothetical protein